MGESLTNCARCGRTTSNLRFCSECAPVRVLEIPPVQDLDLLARLGHPLAPISLCPLCDQLKNLNAYCAPCNEAMAAVAIAAAEDAPAADWRQTDEGTCWASFDDGQLARVSTQTGLVPFQFSILDQTGQPVVRDDALDADRGRRYAECAHHLLNCLQAAMASKPDERGEYWRLAQLSAFLGDLGADPTLPAQPGRLRHGAMDLALLAYWLSLPACLRCQRYSGGAHLCDPCFDAMKRKALDISQEAPPILWRMTVHGNYRGRFDDGHWARVQPPTVGEPCFFFKVGRGELVSVLDACPDLATGRRYAECGHWLLQRVHAKRGLKHPTTPSDALAYITCDLAGMAFWLEQQGPDTEIPYP